MVSFMKSRTAPRLGLFLGRFVSRPQAHRMADFLANRVSGMKSSPVIQDLRRNLAVVHGCPAESRGLDAELQKTLRNAGRSFADWYLAVSRGSDFILKHCLIDRQWDDWIRRFDAADRGTVVVGGHLGGYNIPMMILGLRRIPVQILSTADPRGSYLVDNEVRHRFGAEITPVSGRSLRRALKRLQKGGLVITAVDRADGNGEELVFFGRKARLPSGHVRLALRTDSRILVTMCHRLPDGRHRVAAPYVLDPRDTAGGEGRVRDIAQNIVFVVEQFIRKHPDEWYMFHPVWPG